MARPPNKPPKLPEDFDLAVAALVTVQPPPSGKKATARRIQHAVQTKPRKKPKASRTS